MRRIAQQRFILPFLFWASIYVTSLSGQTFGPTLHMAHQRYGPSTGALANGSVLIVGGLNYLGGLEGSAELYSNGYFYGLTGPGYPRTGASLLTLSTGKVLLIGGTGSSNQCIPQIESYDPTYQQFSTVATLPSGPCYGNATFLPNGQILILSPSNPVVFDPAANSYRSTGPTATSGFWGTAVSLGGGGIFITDGTTAEVYTYSAPANASANVGSFTASGQLNTARNGFTANLLPSGDVLVAGGCPTGNTNALQSTEIWHSSGTFSGGPTMTIPRCLHTSVTLGDGTVMLAGGRGFAGNGSIFGTGFNETASTESYDFVNIRFNSGAPLPYQTFGSAATTIPGNGGVLFTGGADISNQSSISTDHAALYSYPITTGSFAPKYIVLGVLYSPPGKSSSVSYNSSQAIGSSNSIDKAFTSTEKIGISLPSNPGVGTIFDAAGTVSQSWSQEQDSSTGISVQNTIANTLTATPPLSATIGVDHDYDVILVWVNPQVDLAVGPIQDLVLWQGLQSNPADTFVGDLDVLHFSVFCLKNPYVADCPSLQPRYSRPWDTTGPGGLTMADFQDILAADPFAANPNYDPTQDPKHRFDLQPGAGIDYTPEPPGAASSPNGYAFTSTTTTTQGQNATDTHQTEVDLSKISIFGTAIPFSFTSNNTFQWVNKWTSTETQTLGSTTTVSIYPPLYTDFYPQGQPTQFDVYRDNVYGSYMFYANGFSPQSPGQILISPSPVQFGGVRGSSTSAPVQITLTNNSTLPIVYDRPAINFSDPSFSVIPNASSTPDTCSSSTVAAHGLCTVFIQYTPTANQTPIVGSTAVSGTLFASGVTDAIVTASAQIGATALPLFQTSGSIDFGAIPVQSMSATMVATFTNQSSATISLADPAYIMSDPSFVLGAGNDTCSGQDIPPGTSCTIPVQFWPYPPEIVVTGNTLIGGTLTLLTDSGPISSVSLQGTVMVTVLGTPGVGYFSVSGTDQYSLYCDPNNPDICYPTSWDQGVVVIVVVEFDRYYNVNSQGYIADYGYGYSPSDIAYELISQVNSDPNGFVIASDGGPGNVNLVSKADGVLANYMVIGGVYGSYPTPSFQAEFPYWMSGGTDPMY